VEAVEGQEMMGYCPHISNMFGSWHRPYLALFEQILQARAVDIAKEYPIGEARDKAMAIADRVRLQASVVQLPLSRSPTGPQAIFRTLCTVMIFTH
jgi:histidinol phosphatase-like enzyme